MIEVIAVSAVVSLLVSVIVLFIKYWKDLW